MTSVLNNFEILAYSPCGTFDNHQVTSLSRSGATGVFDIAYCTVSHYDSIIKTCKNSTSFLQKKSPIGIRVSKETYSLIPQLSDIFKDFHVTIILSQYQKTITKKIALTCKTYSHRFLIEINQLKHVKDSIEILANLPKNQQGIIFSGQEAGGFSGETASFLLLQKAIQIDTKIPKYLRGGIGVHTASACYSLGLSGIILDDQLLLLKESPLNTGAKKILEKIEARDTHIYGATFSTPYRGVFHPLVPRSKTLLKEIETLETSTNKVSPKKWNEVLQKNIGWGDSKTTVWPIGQTIELAKIYATTCKTTGRCIQYFKKEIQRISQSISVHKSILAKNSPLAQTHGTTFPIVQGPMTRVSDTPEFANAIAAQGGLPFIAVALKKKEILNTILKDTKEVLQDKSWGVGLLGFIEPNLYRSQLESVLTHKPPFALIAGGQPNQVKELEGHNIPTYLHVPSGGLLKSFIRQGVRKFVFEGRECGGHVGPIHSFPLWETAIEILKKEIPDNEKSKVQILFAGGIHDRFSAAIITALSSELAIHGMQSGVLMGTAYLATKEAITTKAITPAFQNIVVKETTSVLLNSAVGHSNRCVKSNFTDEFNLKRKELLQKKTDPDTIREQLDELLLGRLRIASKGVQRDANGNFIDVAEEQQKETGMFMSGDIAKFIDKVQSIQALHEDIAAGADFIKEKKISKKKISKKSTPVDIAIVGMSVHVPGSKELDSFFEHIIAKKQSITEIPLDRWDWRLYYSPDKNNPDKMYSKWGGFIDEIEFDPLEYGIPPKSIPNISVAQLLSLEAVKSSLTDAGYTPDELDKDNVSVIFAGADAAGLFGNELVLRSTTHLFSATEREYINERLPVWTEETFPGTITNVVAGRVANRFDFGGSNYTVDAACASSIVALNNGVRELTSHRSNVAIVGGVEMGQTPHGYMSFSKTQALSEKGKSIPFDKDADGIVISEGLAVLVLKRLEDAERDGDTIYSVIKGVAGSSDGRAMGMTAPRPAGQKKALQRSYEEAGFSTSTIDYYEAHGTGTAVGDQAELTSIAEVLKECNTPSKSVTIGSIKNLIGHTKITAGLVSTVKTALALHHKVIPPQGGVTTPRDIINHKDSPLSLQQKATYWPKPKDHPRRAGISAFGFGGTNYHAVLEEYVSPNTLYGPEKHPSELFIFNATDKDQLTQQLTDWTIVLDSHTDISLKDLAYTAYTNSLSKKDNCKLTIVTDSLNSLKENLLKAIKHIEKPANQSLPKHCNISFKKQQVQGKTAILFPGQGAQYVHMGQELSVYFSQFGNTTELMHQAIGDKYEILPFKTINPPASYDIETSKNQELAINNTHIAQPAIGWSCKSYFDLFTSFGLHYDCLAGHSYGEYTALCAAGVISEEDFFKLSELRGRLMAQSDNGLGGMAAILDTRTSVENYLKKQSFKDVVLANHNHTQQVVISGSKKEVQQVATHFKSIGKTTFILPVSGAFHSSLMQKAQAPLAKAIKEITFISPKKSIYNNTTAQAYPTDTVQIKEQLQNHLLKPVEFVHQIQQMYDDGVQNFIELGPKNILTKCVKDILKDTSHTAYAVEEHGKDFNSFLNFIATLWIQGYIDNTDSLYNGRTCDLLSISTLKNTAPKAPKTTSWIVNGTRSIPVNSKFLEKRKSPLLTLENIDVQKGKQQPVVTQSDLTPAPIAQKTSPVVTNTHVPMQTNDARMEAYEAYQNTMTQFLKTQEAVMQSFLNTPNTSIPQVVKSITPVQPSIIPTPTDISSKVDTKTTVVEDTPAPIKKTPVQKTESIETRLLSIISQKTGYPEDMLDLTLDIEAELGIDSIKRVEIFDEMLRTLSDQAIQAIKQNSQDIVQTKYLKDWITLFKKHEQIEDHSEEKETKEVQAQTTANSISKEYLQQQLITIISEHTGYPDEMIDPTLDIEAELSIDSIKRIEIFDTFIKTLDHQYQDKIQKAAEKIVRHKRIIDWILMIVETLDITTTTSTEVISTTSNATNQITSEELQQKLISIISEHTGYPDEMIDPTLDIEAELSIDSIKRIEIFDTFLKTLNQVQQDKIQKEAEKIVRHKRIIDWIQMAIEALGVEKNIIDISKEDKSTEPVRFARNSTQKLIREDAPRYIMKAIEQELPPFRRKLITGLYIIVPDQFHIAERVASKLEEVGAFTDILPSTICSDPKALEIHIEELRSLFGPVQGIIHLGAIVDPKKQSQEDWVTSSEYICKTLFHLIKICDQDLKNTSITGSKSIIAATNFGGSYGRDLGLKESSPLGGSHLGLLKSLEYEWEHMLPKTIDFETEIHPAQAALCIFKEIQSPNSHFEVGYKEGKRFIFKAAHTPLPIAQSQSPLIPESDWVILVTGGSRGITAEVAKKYAVPGARFILVGNGPWEDFSSNDATTGLEISQIRTHLITQYKATGTKIKPAQIEGEIKHIIRDREITKNISYLRKKGVIVSYEQCDVSNSHVFGQLIDGLYNKYNRIDMVIHGAGMIDDKFISDKAITSFDKVFNTKVSSSMTLYQKLHLDTLKCIAFFSSTAGRFGNKGQTDYAAANEVLNRLAWKIKSEHPETIVKSFNWGPWAQIGMASNTVNEQFIKRGIIPIEPNEGATYFAQELNNTNPYDVEVIFGQGTWDDRKTHPIEELFNEEFSTITLN
ncbi:type I polyketide synthase [uncultured Dokdonia sp.]|uniref:type I polyketide synthase n=1 Tax=uncultured Dokdonia sp. TaxID=575653 RepID=UPI0026252509|nr:type I polyketide synthase [uncultured Dokdonia sp.]